MTFMFYVTIVLCSSFDFVIPVFYWSSETDKTECKNERMAIVYRIFSLLWSAGHSLLHQELHVVGAIWQSF